MDYGRQTGKQVLDELPFPVWVAKAPAGEVLYANKAFRALIGEGIAADIEGAPAAYGIFDRQGRPYAAKGLASARAIQTGQPVVVDDIVIHRRDGGRAWLRAFANPIRDEAGDVTHVVVTFTDISSEVQAVDDRAEIEKHLAVAIHHAPVLLFTLDSGGVLKAAEGALKATLEQGRPLMVGSNLFVAYKDHPTVPANIRRALSGETVSYSVEVQGHTLEVWLGPMRDAAGKVSGAIGVCSDVTERLQLQSRAIQEDRIHAIGTLAASVAHEINNPLTYVLGGLEEARAELEELAADLGRLAARRGQDAEVAAALARVERAREILAPTLAGTERIRHVTRELSTFTRPDAERLSVLELGGVLRSVLKLVRKEIEARARLVEELEPCPPVKANEARLVQVFVNLLMNAWQALPSPDPARHVIGVRTRTERGQAVVEVWDTGPGVPAKMRERIFEPFITTKDIGAGTGLGLFVCRNVVKALDGHISVREAPGGGALFRVVLPPAAPLETVSGEAGPAPAGPGRQARRSRVLIIDDDALVARALVSRFQGGPFDVRAVHDGRVGLEILLGDEDLDLVYCDLMMNGFSGMDVYEAARRRSPQRAEKVVFMTGGAFTTEARSFLAERRHAFVQKPFDILEDAQRRIGQGSVHRMPI
ncbi:MAG TPA: ATP-binding protein [Polyangia bacterium]|nr:ATP-binding protein [Polyangia bacterium]